MESSIKERLALLKEIQLIDSQLDEIKNLRGSLPEEARELEDGLAGLLTRKEKLAEEVAAIEREFAESKERMRTADQKIEKYQEQQKKVRNTREFEAIEKEIEYQQLEMQLLEKSNKKHLQRIEEIKLRGEEIEEEIKAQMQQLELKQKELKELERESATHSNQLEGERGGVAKKIEERLLHSYERIRGNVRNGLAVVSIRRGACGGCFNLVPPQRQADVMEQKKLLVCEYCGRIFCDVVQEESAEIEKKKKKPSPRKTTKKKATTPSSTKDKAPKQVTAKKKTENKRPSSSAAKK